MVFVAIAGFVIPLGHENEKGFQEREATQEKETR